MAIATSEENLAQGKIDDKEEKRFVFGSEDEELPSFCVWLEAIKGRDSRDVEVTESQLMDARNRLRNRRRQQLEKDRQWYSYERQLSHLVSKVDELAEFSELEHELLELGLGIDRGFWGGVSDVMRLPRICGHSG